MTKSAFLVLVLLGSMAWARPVTLAPFDAGKLTVSLPQGWKTTADPTSGVVAAQQDPGRKDAAAILLVIQASTSATEDQLLDKVASSVSSDLKIAKRQALAGGGHVLIGDGTIDGVKVRIGAVAVVAGGTAITCLLVASSGDFDNLGGVQLVSTILGSIKLPAAAAAPAPAPAPATTPNGKLVIPPLTRRLAVSELAGVWKHDDGITQHYFDTSTGHYAGFDTVRFTDKWTFDAKGNMFSEFFGINTNNRVSTKVVDNKPGAASLDSNMVLTIKWKTGPQEEYLVRGLIELPTMTVITLNGPWYDKGVPAETIADQNKSTNLDQHWIRKK